MAYNLLRWEREQGYLMPPSMREWLGEEDLAWFIVDAVEQMDLGEFYGAYRNDGWGAAAYDPKVMVAVLLYAYCQGLRPSLEGLRSSRRIAMALEDLSHHEDQAGVCAGLSFRGRTRWLSVRTRS
ncbi:MAG: hypothetical protein ABID84_03965 [Chloroflexota bacterium]